MKFLDWTGWLFQHLLEEGWQQVRPEVEVKLVPTPQGEEPYVLCRLSPSSGQRRLDRPSENADKGKGALPFKRTTEISLYEMRNKAPPQGVVVAETGGEKM